MGVECLPIGVVNLPMGVENLSMGLDCLPMRMDHNLMRVDRCSKILETFKESPLKNLVENHREIEGENNLEKDC